MYEICKFFPGNYKQMRLSNNKECSLLIVCKATLKLEELKEKDFNAKYKTIQ